MERRIDRNNWKRNAHDALFARLEVPFYSVTWRLDVTDAVAYARRTGVSFYATMMWATMKAVNGVEAFRYELRGDDVYLLDHRNPSYTCPWDGELFGICGVEWIDGESPAAFAARCKAAESQSASPIPTQRGTTYTCRRCRGLTIRTSRRSFRSTIRTARRASCGDGSRPMRRADKRCPIPCRSITV